MTWSLIGTIVVRAAFLSSIVAAAGYIRSLRTSSEKALRLGRSAFFVSSILTVSSAGLLMAIILTHQFQYSYVWNFSSRDLPFPLLVSTFYAGQEGSFHLWTLYTVIVGLLLIRFTRTRGYERHSMGTFAAILAGLQLMLVIKNPFALLTDTMTVLGNNIPVDGRGLNPLLQNYWMVIHPPILFLGFTIMAVPFVLSIAAMVQKDFSRWIALSLPWLNAGAMVLGLGVVLGGFWAYETLGWGGYWAWDPVENSSLIPWLVAIAAIHTSLVQSKSGGLVRTNLVLALLPFILVLYSTFLTRSGVLGDTSVHSFVEPGMILYWLLLGMVLLAVLVSAIIYGINSRRIPQYLETKALISRELMLYLGSTSLLFFAIFVTAGTSAPLITGLIHGKASAVDVSYYVTTSLPLTAFILLLSGLGQLALWGTTPLKLLSRKSLPALCIAFVGCIVLWVMGVRHAGMMLLAFTASFGLVVNLHIGIRKYVKKLRLAASATAHVGLAVLIFGIIGSAKYDQKSILSLEQGHPQSFFGYDFTYAGFKALDRGRFAFIVEIMNGVRKYSLEPVMFENSQNGELMRTPDILSMLTKDVYVAPLNLELAGDRPDTSISLVRGRTVSVGGTAFRYEGYGFTADSAEGNIVTLQVAVDHDGKKEIIKPGMVNRRGEVSYTAASTPDGAIRLVVTGMDLTQASAAASFDVVWSHRTGASEKKDILLAEISVKPFIVLVWSGAGLIVLGFLLAAVKRLGGSKATPDQDDDRHNVSEKTDSTPGGSME